MITRVITRITFFVFAVAAVAIGAAAQERPGMVVTPEWLAAHLKDPNLVLLQVGAKGEYETGHILGAQPIALTDISTPFRQGELSLELPSVEQLKATFEKLGISDNSRVIVYFGNDWVTPTTRVIFTLTYMGLGDRTSLLDGGLPAWIAAGHTATTDVTMPATGKLTPHPHPELVVDAAWVASHLHQPSISIIDAREEHAFLGDDPKLAASPNLVPGHIPSAHSIPMEMLTNGKGGLKDQSAISAIFSDAGIRPGSQVVSYCWVGQRATLIWFVARMKGYDAHLYDGSWQDWTARKDLPIEMPPATKPDHQEK